MPSRYTIIGEMVDTKPKQFGSAEFGAEKWTLTHGKSRGVEMIGVRCGPIVGTILPTRGMGVANLFVGGKRIGWDSPVGGPVHPAYVAADEPSGLGWLDGFSELLARCGLISNGAPQFDASGRLEFGLHGRIANTPAQFVEVELDESEQVIRVTGVVEEARFHFHRLELRTAIEFDAREQQVRVFDTVTNLYGRRTQMQMLYHWNFGPPLLGPGSNLVAPVQRICPRSPAAAAAIDGWNQFDAPTSSFAEHVYFMELFGQNDQTAVMLSNSSSDFGIELEYPVSQLPCFTLWKNMASEAEGYVVGLEPGINFPNPTSFEQKQGRTVSLEPQESYTMQTTISILDSESITKSKSKIEAMQADKPICEKEPVNDWIAES